MNYLVVSPLNPLGLEPICGIATQFEVYYIIIIGLIAGLLAIILYLFRRKMPKKLNLTMIALFAIIFILYSVEYSEHTEASCAAHEPTRSIELKLLPEDIIPL